MEEDVLDLRKVYGNHTKARALGSEALCQQQLHESVSLDAHHSTCYPLPTEHLKCGWLEFRYRHDFENVTLKKKKKNIRHSLVTFILPMEIKMTFNILG